MEFPDLFFLFSASWLALTWLFLPSPSHDDDCIGWPSKLINEHKEFVRIYETSRFFPPPPPPHPFHLPSPYPPPTAQHPSIALAHALNRRHFALTFALDARRQYLVINNQQRIAVQNANADERFSAPVVVTAPAGDPAALFPPWFDVADRTLLSWSLAPETTVLTLRASWSASGGPMEIWPDGDSWERRWLPPRGVRPLLAVSVVDGAPPGGDVVVSAPPLSWSPSDTFAARERLFGWLFPVCFLVARLVRSGCCGVKAAAVVLVKGVVGVVVLGGVAWVVEGRPRWEVFVEGLRKDVRRICCQWGCCGSGRGGEGGGVERVRGKNQSVDLLEKGQGMLTGKEKG
ncbi:hypothetical protein GTA08_BOTSDO09221 [Neofusicoccum parvum]|uniref:Uncharacterized protein n=1 Tax=Neofusicoccum parvum TaxID=310453 RepID=A0ACB5S8K8_9PEZI|nr:hypothetical protein GTA08_BOTSDO09221 [Neofusicoccum parvum]